MNSGLGKYIIIIGIIIVVLGVVIYLFSDKLNWLGNLPGDIKIEGDNFKFYFPIVTMVIVSLVLTLFLNLFKRLF